MRPAEQRRRKVGEFPAVWSYSSDGVNLGLDGGVGSSAGRMTWALLEDLCESLEGALE